jgi:hypothetical protein
MKTEGGLLIDLSSELSAYFKNNPDKLPAAVDIKALEIKCSSYLIEHIENYSKKPFTDKFLWCLVFPASAKPRFEYLYIIDYKAFYNGGHEVISAQLVYEKQIISDAWYLSN